MLFKSNLIKCFVVLLLLGVTSAGWAERKPLEKPILKIKDVKLSVERPNPFSAVTRIETIIRNLRKYFSIGWIDNQAIVESLEEKLEAARVFANKKDKIGTKNNLQAFLKDLELQEHKKHICPRAASMLREYAQTFIDKHLDNAPEFIEYYSAVRFDPKTSNYIFSWKGYDGTRKSVIFEPATKIDVIVKVKIESTNRGYKYEYKVVNLKTSLQDIRTFAVEYGAPVVRASSPDGWLSRSFVQKPVWGWLGKQKLTIKPGDSFADFTFQSKGLPGIVKCYAQGYTKIMEFPEEKPSEIGKSIPKHFENMVSGKTIGPVSVSKDFNPLIFANNLSSLVQESFSLGWIDDEEVVRSLEEKLKEASFNIGLGLNRTLRAIRFILTPKLNREARNSLESFVNEVESQKDKHILPEAHALLTFNAHYLIDHLVYIPRLLIILIIGAILVLALATFLFIRIRRKKKTTTV